MRFVIQGDSRVLIDLRATGLLAGLGHDPTFRAAIRGVTVEGVGDPVDAAVDARFPVDAIEAPEGLSASDRDKMLDNLRGRDVLDASRFPTVDLRARYRGTFGGGTLSGDLIVRGVPRPLSMPVAVSREGELFVATGQWEGPLMALGVKPFRALLGALKLEDWIRLRLRATFAPVAP